jgi:hypothetical protein
MRSMTPDIGQKVVLYMRYNMQVEGIVYEWNEDQIILSSESNFLVIYNPSNDLLMSKIIGKPKSNPEIQNDIANGKWYSIEQNNTGGIDEEDTQTYDVGANESGIFSVQNDFQEIEEEQELIQQEIEETIAMPSVNDLRLKKLANLRKSMGEIDRKIVSSKLSGHISPVEVKEVEYGNQISILPRAK